MDKNIDLIDLKRRGFISQRQEGMFVFKARTPASGSFTSAQMRKLADISDRYAAGILHPTVRQGIEIPFISYERIPDVEREIGAVGIGAGIAGPGLRAITACPGNNWCKFGLVNTFGLNARIENELGIRCGLELPHKFKITISGCPNGCTRPEASEIGVHGRVMGGETGYSVYLGGCGGRNPSPGIRLEKLFTEDEALKVIKRALEYYKLHAKPRQRFSALIAETGRDKFLSHFS